MHGAALLLVGAATGASVAVGLLYWSFLWLVRGTEGSLAGLILIFVASTFTLIIDDGPKLRVDLYCVKAECYLKIHHSHS